MKKLSDAEYELLLKLIQEREIKSTIEIEKEKEKEKEPIVEKEPQKEVLIEKQPENNVIIKSDKEKELELKIAKLEQENAAYKQHFIRDVEQPEHIEKMNLYDGYKLEE